jgi:hypothetical protein
MTITVQSILDEVAGDIQDTGKVRTTNARLLEFYNNALLQVVIVRPDANADSKAVALVTGTKQDIPDGDIRLLDVVRNMGVAGNTPGNAILQGDMDTQNRYSPGWHSAAGSQVVEEWFYDFKRNPTVFYVSPPVTTPCYVEMTVASSPTTVTDPNTDMEFEDVYKGPVMHWMKYLFYVRQTESAFALNKAITHERSFYQSLGIKYQAEKLVAPPVKAQESNA